jgi:hypothetical protein
MIGAVTAIAFLSLLRMRVTGGVDDAHLGWMSEQWLAEHRAAHPP